jgi:hypothetical protein
VDFLSKFPNLVQLAAWNTTISPLAAGSFIKARFPENKQRRIKEEIAALESRLAAMKVEVLGVEIPKIPAASATPRQPTKQNSMSAKKLHRSHHSLGRLPLRPSSSGP